MNTRHHKYLLLLPVLAFLCGCQVFPMAIAPSTTPLEPGKYTELGRARGDSTGYYVFFIPVSSRSTLESAIEEALETTHADALINVTADVKMTYLILFNFITTTVYGDAVKVNR